MPEGSGKKMLTASRRDSVLVPCASRRGSQAVVLISEKPGGVPTGTLLAELMEKAGAGWYQALVLPSLLGVTVVECGQIQLMASIAGALQLEWGLTSGQKASLPSLAFCGLAIGTILSGFISDTLGRRRAVLGGFMATALSSASLALAAGYVHMAFLAFVNGIACGIGVTAAMVLITELCPPGVRAAAFILPLLAQAIGEVYAISILDLFMPDLVHGNWRAVVLCAALPTYIFLVITYYYLRESPYWLVVQGRLVEARTEILEIARVNGTLKSVDVLAQTLNCDVVAGASSQADSKESTSKVLFRALSSAPFAIKASCFGLLCFIGQLLTFGMSYFWPALLESPGFGNDSLNPATTLGLIRFCGVPSALLMIPLMQSSIGHRWIVGATGLLQALIMHMFGVAIAHWAGGLLVIPVAGLSLACANLFYAASLIFMTESYPTTVRAIMAALSVSFGRLGALAGPALVELLGFEGFLAVVVGLSVAAVPVLILLKETKGKELEDFLDETPTEQLPLLSMQPAKGCGEDSCSASASGLESSSESDHSEETRFSSRV